MITNMEQLLNKMNNNAYRRHMSVHDEKGNKKYFKDVCKRIDKDMKELGDWCEESDRLSFIEYLEDIK